MTRFPSTSFTAKAFVTSVFLHRSRLKCFQKTNHHGDSPKSVQEPSYLLPSCRSCTERGQGTEIKFCFFIPPNRSPIANFQVTCDPSMTASRSNIVP
jgi:hypothetical protein